VDDNGVRPTWLYRGKPTKRDSEENILEMLESIRNVLEGILEVLQKSEIVYMRGEQKNG
jgi:hypothetical protein